MSIDKKRSASPQEMLVWFARRSAVIKRASMRLLPVLGLLILSWFSPSRVVGQQEELFFPAKLHFTDNPKVQLATRLIDGGEYAKAAEILEDVLKTHPKDSFARELLKQAYLNLKEYEKLEALIRKELDRNPGSVQLLSELADLYFKQDRTERGVSLLEKALKLKPREINTYRLVADAYSRNRMFPEAIETYRIARITLKQPYAFAFETAGMYETLGQWRQASLEYLLYLRGNPKKLRSVSQRLSAIIQTGDDRGEVKSAISSAIRENPKEVSLYRLYGEILLETGEFEQALESYKICEALSKGNTAVLLDFSTKCLEYRAYDTALEAIRYFLKSESPSGHLRHRALFNMAKAYQGINENEKAIEAYREVIESKPFSKLEAEAALAVADIELRKLNDPQRALKDYQEVVKAHPVGPYHLEAQLRSADCLLMMGDLEQASKLYSEVACGRERSQAVEEARLRSGDLQLYSGDYKKANTIYRRLIRDFPKGFFVNDGLERQFVLTELQDTSTAKLRPLANLFVLEAQSKYEQALALMDSLDYSESPFMRQMLSYRRASINRELGNPKEALRSLDQIIKNSPEGFYAPFSLLLKARILAEDLGRQEEARRVYKEIVDSYGDSLVSEEARERLRALGSS